jgi:hypothetical protein
MTSRTPTRARRLASTLVATALTAGASAGALAVTSTPAQAAGATAGTYTCTPALGAPFDVPASFTVPGLPAELTAGVPTAPLPVSGTLTLANTSLLNPVIALLGGTLQAVTSTVLVPLGAGQVGVTLQSAVTTVGSGTGALLTQVGGTLPSFTPDATGDFTIPLPTTLTINLLGSLGVPVPCTLKPTTGTGGAGTGGGSMANYKVVKGGSSIDAAPREPSVRVGQSVTVDVAASTSTGVVTIEENGRQLGSQSLSGGRATFLVPGLAQGWHTLRVVFPGTWAINAAEKSVTVQVVKAPTTKHKKPKKKHKHKGGKGKGGKGGKGGPEHH